jgi:catecholate siderophore receptor
MALPPVNVDTNRPTDGGYKAEQPSLPKLTEPLRDTPQSITSVPRAVIDDQGANTLRDTLRNVPGISLAAGEGGAQGDNTTIRGFSARNDIFIDGIRDFGSYYRDSFNFERVDVLKGPSSILFGRGSTGGVINQVSKTPRLEPFVDGSAALGTDDTRRLTADVNQPIPELGQGAAARLNLMAHESGVADRDVVYYSRFGVAPSLALGIGTPTRLNFGYFHLSEDDIPDYGHPFFLSRPTFPERSNFYGFAKGDFLNTDVDVLSAQVEHDFSPALTLRSQFRFGNYQRSIRATEPQILAGTPSSTLVSALRINRNQITAESTERILENQTDVTARFTTGPIEHTAVAGIEISREDSKPVRTAFTGVPTTTLVAPNPDDAFAGTPRTTSATRSTVDTRGVYALDTLKLGEQWQLIGGLRFDNFDSKSTQSVPPATSFRRIDDVVSYRLALVYKPVEAGAVYVSYGNSFNPSAEAIALAAANASTPPEETTVLEAGAKWDVTERLALRGAVFRDDKTNARTPDPNNALLNVVQGEQRVDGFELEATGRVTDRWQVFAGYAYLDSRVLKSTTVSEIGRPLQNTPRHSGNLWTTYDLPGGFQIGGGAFYVGSRAASTVPDAATGLTRQVPGYVRFDAMAKYAITEHVDLQLNLYNLTDKYYYETIHPAHLIPGGGRSALITTFFHF